MISPGAFESALPLQQVRILRGRDDLSSRRFTAAATSEFCKAQTFTARKTTRCIESCRFPAYVLDALPCDAGHGLRFLKTYPKWGTILPAPAAYNPSTFASLVRPLRYVAVSGTTAIARSAGWTN